MSTYVDWESVIDTPTRLNKVKDILYDTTITASNELKNEFFEYILGKYYKQYISQYRYDNTTKTFYDIQKFDYEFYIDKLLSVSIDDAPYVNFLRR